MFQWNNNKRPFRGSCREGNSESPSHILYGPFVAPLAQMEICGDSCAINGRSWALKGRCCKHQRECIDFTCACLRTFVKFTRSSSRPQDNTHVHRQLSWHSRSPRRRKHLGISTTFSLWTSDNVSKQLESWGQSWEGGKETKEGHLSLTW